MFRKERRGNEYILVGGEGELGRSGEDGGDSMRYLLFVRGY